MGHGNLDLRQGGRPLLDAELRPHRSLSKRGFRILMAAAAVTGAGVGTAFFLIGAWPVAGFCGLEILLIYVAFRANYRSGERREHLRLSDRGLEVHWIDGTGRSHRHFLEPTWLQVRMDDPPRDDSQLTLTSHGLSFVIGRFLTPAERLEVAQALKAALRDYRSPHRAAGVPAD